jgi:cell surface protein SprA
MDLTTINDDDGLPKCAEIWVNELRLTGFNKQSGWATTGRVAMNLADLGNVAFSASYSSPWFSSIDKKITEIPLEGATQFDIATNLQLGKFFPEKTGIKIPMHFDYGEARIKPKYNPLDPDLQLEDVLDSYELESQRDSLKNITIDYTQRRNINFMNVRKDKVGQQQSKPRPWDVENFNVSYSYSEIFHRNMDIEFDKEQNYMGSLGYNFNNSPKNVKPFEKVGFIANSKALTLLKDFNFYFLPKMFSFNTNMNRDYGTRKLRNKSFGKVITQTMYDKNWTWNRNYDLKFDLATSLTLNYSANASSFINELPGSNSLSDSLLYDGERVYYSTEDKKQRVKDEIRSGGTKNGFTQNLGLNYNIPINKLPGLDWVTATAGYQVSYNWNGSPMSIRDELGNSIANNQNYNINGNADLNKLYNKSKFLKDINQPPRNKSQRGGKRNNKQAEQEADSTKKKPKVNYGKIAYESVLKILMSVKKVSFQYSVNNGTTLPGFMPEPQMIGNNWNNNAPGLPFIFGYQPENPDYFNSDWLSVSDNMNTSFNKLHNNTYNIRVNLEPFKDFKIEITADRTYSRNYQSYYPYNDSLDSFLESGMQQMGSFTMSYLSWGTAFGGSLANEKSEFFENMKAYRLEIANQIAEDHRIAIGDPNALPINDTTGFPEGYGPTSQYVLLPAFEAAYSGKSPDKLSTNAFPTAGKDQFQKFPLPNWRISYSGLAKIPALKNIFKSITVNHVYRSSYSVGSYSNNINFVGDTIEGRVYPNHTDPENLKVNGDFFPVYEYGMVAINEQFSPLINFDMTLQNSFLAKLEMKRSRTLTLSFANNQLTEVNSNEFIIGAGYRFKDVPLTFAGVGGGGARTFRSDLNIKADFSIRDNKTVLRSIDSELNQVSNGMKVMSINTSVDYMLSQSLTIRFFFDKIVNNPYLPSQFRNSTTKGGFSLRFSLAQ